MVPGRVVAAARRALATPARAGDSRQDGILRYAYARAGGTQPFGDEYPAHLHIDLLPETQGQGLGRRLIETLVDALQERACPGCTSSPRPTTPAPSPSTRASGSSRCRRPRAPGHSGRASDATPRPTGVNPSGCGVRPLVRPRGRCLGTDRP